MELTRGGGNRVGLARGGAIGWGWLGGGGNRVGLAMGWGWLGGGGQ